MYAIDQALAPSARKTLEDYSQPAFAERYRRRHRNVGRHDREAQAILRALGPLPRRAHVLDLPCGAGRMVPELLGAGYRVTAADGSTAMLGQAVRALENSGVARRVERFVVANVFAMPFADGMFDAVVVNRLFHHFTEPVARRAALKEIARVTRGPAVVSFFCTHALDHWLLAFRRSVIVRRESVRSVIAYREFAEDARAAGLDVERIVMARPWISRHWYAVLRPRSETL